jgi:hypothetical protein
MCRLVDRTLRAALNSKGDDPMQQPRLTHPVALLAATIAFTTACGENDLRNAGATEPEHAALAALSPAEDAVHKFETLADGGRITVQLATDDRAGVTRVRRHLQSVARILEDGDFVAKHEHAREVPGALTLAAKKDQIAYEYRELPRGGEVRFITSDAEANQAISEFMAYHQEKHKAGGMDHEAMKRKHRAFHE